MDDVGGSGCHHATHLGWLRGIDGGLEDPDFGAIEPGHEMFDVSVLLHFQGHLYQASIFKD